MSIHITPHTRPSKSPWWLRLALLGGGLWLAWSWLVLPGYQISQVEPKPHTKDTSPLPPKGFVQRIEAYQQARSSPFLRSMANARLKRAITQFINPRRIERTFQASLQHTSLAVWQRRYQLWDHTLERLQELLPTMEIRAYRVYLRLQAGMFDLLLHEARTLPSLPPQSRLQALRRIWLGHAAYWCGDFSLATHIYRSFFKGLATHPDWEQRSPNNWRLPSEISTTLYHMGMLHLLASQPRQALRHFARMARRWAALRQRPQHHAGVYFARLLAAEAARQAGDTRATQRWLAQASTFSGDTTLHRWLLAHTAIHSPGATPQQKHKGYQGLLQLSTHARQYKHGYADTQALASLHLVAYALQHKHTDKALARLRQLMKIIQSRSHPPTLSVLAAHNSFSIRFLPASPALYGRIIQQLQMLERTHQPYHQAPRQTPRQTPRPALRPALRPAPRQALRQALPHQPSTQPTAVSRPAPGGGRRAISKAISRPTTMTTARVNTPSRREHQPGGAKRPGTLTDMRIALQLMQALAYLKRYAWEDAIQLLERILGEKTHGAKQAHLYLGMLYTQRRDFLRASRHLVLYYRAYPQDMVGRIYLGHALWMRRRFKDARRLLTPLLRSKYWRRTIERLLPSPKMRKEWQTLRKQAGFWWRLLGDRGWLSILDPQLSQRALLWSQYPHLRHNPLAQQIFHALRTSHLRSRFGLLTMLARHRLQAQMARQRPGQASHKAPLAYQIALHRWRQIRRLYDLAPHLEYIQDRALYSHRWGTFALGFF